MHFFAIPVFESWITDVYILWLSCDTIIPKETDVVREKIYEEIVAQKNSEYYLCIADFTWPGNTWVRGEECGRGTEMGRTHSADIIPAVQVYVPALPSLLSLSGQHRKRKHLPVVRQGT